MIRVCLLLLSFLSISWTLKVMTVNMHQHGSNIIDGIVKLASQIKSLNPDIVALQETGTTYELRETNFKGLLSSLGNEWSGAFHCSHDTGMVTRHEILGLYEHIRAGMNTRIRLSETGQEISVWSLRLFQKFYAPCEFRSNSTTLQNILDKEFTGRIEDIVDLLKHPQFVQQIKNSNNVPVIVAGDFNSPSHLDYTEDTKNEHHNFVVDWPVTKLLTGAAGMTDSFREAHPDPKLFPGATWPVYRKGGDSFDDKDRIDFIFYRGSLRAKLSTTYAAKVDQLNPKASEWLSDHLAVITEFENTPRKNENNPSFFIGETYQYKDKVLDKCPLKIIH